MATIQNIKQRAQQVKDATQIGENTANRVGGVLVDMADHLEDDENQLTSLYPADAVPTAGSTKPVQSGGVLNSVIRDGSAFDLSAHTGGSYASLTAALTAMSGLPAAYKKGGMSIKFIQSSDNKYVQYRYIGTETTGNPNPFLDTANWQGVDVAPTDGSKNLVESGGVFEENKKNLIIINPIETKSQKGINVNTGEFIDAINTYSYRFKLKIYSVSEDFHNIQIYSYQPIATTNATAAFYSYNEVTGVYTLIDSTITATNRGTYNVQCLQIPSGANRLAIFERLSNINNIWETDKANSRIYVKDYVSVVDGFNHLYLYLRDDGYLFIDSTSIKFKGLSIINGATGNYIRITDGTHDVHGDNVINGNDSNILYLTKEDVFSPHNTLVTLKCGNNANDRLANNITTLGVLSNALVERSLNRLFNLFLEKEKWVACIESYGHAYYDWVNSKFKFCGLYLYATKRSKIIRITDGTNNFDEENEINVELGKQLIFISKYECLTSAIPNVTLQTKNYDSLTLDDFVLDLAPARNIKRDTALGIIGTKTGNLKRLSLLMGATPDSNILSEKEWGKKVWTTPRYLEVNDSIVLYSNSYFCCQVRKFNDSFVYSASIGIIASSLDSVSGKYKLEFRNLYSKYIKLNFVNNTDINLITDFVPDIEIVGLIKEIYTKTSSNNIALSIPVNVTNPNSCDEMSSTVQDQENILYDYGVLNLPSSYSNLGKPTRMIIFCHGSAIHYVKGQTTFQTTAYGTDPAYWLSEGYAVMDIEGNPFNNSNVHKFVPQAYECYKSAYNYVTEIFNICKDGVFLGGRSLGGGMCFDIITRSGIPVIAACPFVPSFPNSFMMFSFYNAKERAFTALHMGMTGTITWTANNPLTDDEIAYLAANKDKFVRYTPSWRAIYDLPAFSILETVAKANGSYNEDENNLYSGLRIKTNIPVKLFGALDDSTVPYRRGIQLWYNMLCNGGNICEMRMFETGGHPFDLASQNKVATFVNTKGETLSNVPIAYIEALQFWRRYEQGS